ncbi:MAG TPA: hypothetical protein VK805_16660 [Candidatus Baltobacteraceae bacterium]|nr:hypothetical protein [Candidatus Baltobacteraceae bacterium]
MPLENNLPDLPPYSLDVQAMDLGSDTKAVGLELIETESREPLRGEEAASIWAAVFPALTGEEAWVLDFFSHLDRVREYCKLHEVEFREAANRCVVIQPLPGEKLRALIVRFAGETFGLRCGAAAKDADTTVESELSHRGLDAYQDAYTRYTFCAICEPDDGWMTLLSQSLWPSEIIRRARPALQPFDVHIARPQ